MRGRNHCHARLDTQGAESGVWVIETWKGTFSRIRWLNLPLHWASPKARTPDLATSHELNAWQPCRAAIDSTLWESCKVWNGRVTRQGRYRFVYRLITSKKGWGSPPGASPDIYLRIPAVLALSPSPWQFPSSRRVCYSIRIFLTNNSSVIT